MIEIDGHADYDGLLEWNIHFEEAHSYSNKETDYDAQN